MSESDPKPAIKITEKPIRPGAEFESLSQEARDYIAKATIDHKVEITRWLVFVFAIATAVFLGIYIAWGMGLMPNIDKEQIKWFGGATVLSIVGLITTIITSRWS